VGEAHAVSVRILQGDCRDVLKTLPDESVHCVVTSPPYWGLRDYGVAGQLGLESTPQEYIEKMVAVFREVRRVLRSDGTLWLNMGDCYATGTTAGRQASTGVLKHHTAQDIRRLGTPDGLKTKDLVGMPWRLAFALQEDGWWLRQDIIWSKPNPMPESVRDRCTKAHEYLFLLAKSERYYFDSTGIQEPCSSAYDPDDCKAPDGWDTGDGGHGTIHRLGREKGKSGNKARKPASARGVPMRKDQTAHAGMAIQSGLASQASHHPTNGDVAGSVPWEGSTRNKRSVWTVTTQPFKEAHFATFPPALIEPCVLAGCPIGGTVLDPFGGAGTTGLVADRLGRDAILIELNPLYADMARKRIVGDAPLFAEVA
jgi:DNA modification methylase